MPSLDVSELTFTPTTPLHPARIAGGARISSLPSKKRKRVTIPQPTLEKQTTSFSFNQRSLIPGRSDFRGTKRKPNSSSTLKKHTGAKLRRAGESSDTSCTSPTRSDVCVSDNQATVSAGCTLSPLNVEELMDKGDLSNVFYFSPANDCVSDFTCSVMYEHVVCVNVCLSPISLELAAAVD